MREHPDTTENYVTIKEVRGRLNVSRWTVDRLIKTGELDAIKGAGPKGLVRISETSLTSYIERHTVKEERSA